MNYVGKRLNSVSYTHKIVLISLQAMFSMSSPQLQIIEFGLDFTKLYQFNIKQMEMCNLFWATL